MKIGHLRVQACRSSAGVPGSPTAHSNEIPVNLRDLCAIRSRRGVPGLKTSVRSNRQIFLRPAGNPRFGRTTSQPPRPSGTSRLRASPAPCCPWLMATLIDESVGCIQPLRDQPKRTTRRRVVAEIDFDVVIARDALVPARVRMCRDSFRRASYDARDVLSVVVDRASDLVRR